MPLHFPLGADHNKIPSQITISSYRQQQLSYKPTQSVAYKVLLQV